MPQTLLIAPTAFKGSLSALAAAQIMADTWRQHRPDDTLISCPMADGGNDTLAVLAHHEASWQTKTAPVTGPLPEITVTATFLTQPQTGMAVVESAQAHGLHYLQPNQYSPRTATSYGVGELIRHAADQPNINTLTVCLGGSASTDGGAGALQSLGFRFYNQSNTLMPHPVLPQHLPNVARIEPPAEPTSLQHLQIATDVTNPLLGTHGTATVYAPQKGAGAEDIAFLETAMTHWASLCHTHLGTDHTQTPGSGAAGGLGFGLLQLTTKVPNTQIISGADWIHTQLNLDAHIAQADIILTGEGRFDAQSLQGKGTGALIQKAGNKPVLILCGSADEALPLPPNVHRLPLVNAHTSLAQAMARPEQVLQTTLQTALKTVLPTLDRSGRFPGRF